MQRKITKLFLLAACLNLAGCYTNFFQPNPSTAPTVTTSQKQNTEQMENMSNLTASDAPLSTGNLARAMDANDKMKMSTALDKAIGKSTHWFNSRTNVGYTVTPVKKVNLNGNHLCRQYDTVMTIDHQDHSSSGTACISADGGWHSV